MEELRVPGPTPCPPEVLQAMAKQMINHRGDEFEQMMQDVTSNLKQLFQTRNDVLLLTGSGTGGLEAVAVNILSPGDKVLALSVGAFGERFITIAQKFGADVIPLRFDWGKPVDVEAVRKSLQAEPKIKAVMVTHNETSTGVTNDLAAISSVVKEFDKLLLVDAISSLGSIDLPVDKWHCDVVVTASQKGWMVPPGMAMVSVSEEAWKAQATARMPRFYWDFAQAKKYLGKWQTPWTPAVSIVFAFSVALEMMLEEGLENVFARHARVARAAREGVKALGLSLFAEEGYASNTVTAVNSPAGVDSEKLLQLLRDEHQIELAEGQAHLVGKVFRIGHLGWVTENNIEKVIKALKVVLPELGFVTTAV
ncbi:MAG: alanine--glyoxylate aminotransferase family protein [Dehalococcoidales bacterium]|nr:alanine--glyoxylate aminotransferase family protein [Dehalococcoidales bacterium]